MKTIKLLIAFLFLSSLFFMGAKSTWASEGTVELSNTGGQNARCFATSVLMKDFNYSLTVSCRDLIYPPAADMFSYILWSTSVKDGKPVKIGELGIGKAYFTTRDAFSNLFVTAERDNRANSPSQFLVMQGNVQTIGFLENPQAPTPSVVAKPTPTPKTATPSAGLIGRIGRAVATLFIALFGLAIVLVAIVITLRRFRE